MSGLLKTKPICILTSGHTIDGRKVSEQTLTEMAESYDPSTYNARINIDHSGYGYKLGSVLSLEVKEAVVNGKPCKQLFAEMEPNDYFLYLVQQGQKIHTSAEIQLNFANTNKAYLMGLALTDNPASLGTDQLKLSAKDGESEQFHTGESIQFNNEKTNFFKNFLTKEKDNGMVDKATLEIFSQMKQQLDGVSKSQTTLTDKIEGLILQKETPDEEPKVSELQTLTNQVAELKQSLSSTTAELSDLKTQLESETDDPTRKEATGNSDDDANIVL